MKFEIKEIDNAWVLKGERRWGDDSDNEQIEKSFATLKQTLSAIQKMADREFRQRTKG